MSHLTSTQAAIDAARDAASAAGVSLRNTRDNADRVRDPHQPWRGDNVIAYGLELTGLTSAVHIGELQKAVAEIPGVQVSINYESKVAWVTSPDVISPVKVVDKFAEFGVDAQLTENSLHRRSLPLGDSPERERKKIKRQDAAVRASGYFAAEVQAENKQSTSPYEVLFTAWELLTTTRLWISIVFAVPVLVFSYYTPWQFPYWQWVCLALATPVVFYGAWPFHRAAIGGIRRGQSALDAASSLAVVAAYAWSIFLLVTTPTGVPGWRSSPAWFAIGHARITQGELFLDVACGMTVLLLAGRRLSTIRRATLLEDWSHRVGDSTRNVTVVRRNVATGTPKRLIIPLTEVRIGDDLIIPTDAPIPCDGEIIGGAGSVEVRFGRIEGERHPVKVGSRVYAGSVNRGGPVKVRVKRLGSKTRMGAVRRWILQAVRGNNNDAYVATKSASLLVPAAISIAVIDFSIWWLVSSNLNASFASALAVLACVGPVAMALSTSLAMRLGLEVSARKGVLIRDAQTMRELVATNVVIFNRVGTITKGKATVETVTAEYGEDPELILHVAAALVRDSQHSASQALVRADRIARDSTSSQWIDATDVEITDDGSFVGRVTVPDGDGEMVTVEAQLWRPRELSDVHGRLGHAISSGGAPLVVSWAGQARGVITLRDDMKDDAPDAIGELENMGIDTMMLTRDMYPVARRFANSIGLSKVLAGIPPGGKMAAVRSVHTAGNTVAMVGDSSVLGCLRVADVGIFSGVADVLEVEEADVMLMRDDVMAIPETIRLARRVAKVADRNILLTWIYNIVAMVLAVSGLLNPMFATLLMVLSSTVVEWLSARVSRF
ncbi:MAG: HAD-IC family P-type ATPase [Corynebacterium sp.]|nr:HAD-IC family P-type ATPase [Corynebacterium sp.]